MSEASPTKISRARKAWLRKVRAIAKARQRGRKPITRSGDGNLLAVLTTAKVAKMRELAAQGVPVSDLAQRFGVNYRTAWAAVTRRTWRT